MQQFVKDLFLSDRMILKTFTNDNNLKCFGYSFHVKHILQNTFKLRRSVAHVVSAVFQVSPCPSTSLVFIFTPNKMQGVK